MNIKVFWDYLKDKDTYEESPLGWSMLMYRKRTRREPRYNQIMEETFSFSTEEIAELRDMLKYNFGMYARKAVQKGLVPEKRSWQSVIEELVHLTIDMYRMSFSKP